MADVVVVGGGIIGLSVAYHLAQAGITDVLLLEQDEFLGTGSTAKAAGGIRAQFSTPVNIEMSRLAISRWERFAEEMGVPFEFVRSGYLFLTSRPAKIPLLEENIALQRRFGVPVDLLRGDEVRRRWPWLRADDIVAAAFGPADGYATPNDAVAGYAKRARELGVSIRCLSKVTRIERTGKEVSGVVVEGGERVPCRTLVLATGAAIYLLAADLGVDVPIRPVRRMIFFTDPTPTLPGVVPLTIDLESGLYFRKETGGLLLGRSREDEPFGFNEDVDWDYAAIVVEYALNRLPFLERASIINAWAGVYEVTPDHHPIIGRVPGIPNLVIAGGFSGHGFMQAPAAGLLVAEMIRHGAPRTLDIRAFRLERFAEGDLVEERNVI